MKVNIKYPKQDFYATILNIDIKSLSDGDFSALRKIIESCGVTVIKNQRVNDDDQIAFSKRFGELEISIGINHKKENNPYLNPQISRISNVDIVNDKCPDADFVFCKDLIIHISNNCVKKIVNNVKKTRAKYFMSTTAFLPKVIMPGGKIGTIEVPESNVDLPLDAKHGYLMGDRTINLFLPPFCFPDPLFLVGSAHHFQMMALWETKDIPYFELNA